MHKIINEWLKQPLNRYQDGVAIFKSFASAEIKKKYLAYFEEVKDEPQQFDPHFTMLVNKICAIRDKVRINPEQFKDVALTLVLHSDNTEELQKKNEEIEALKEEIQTLEYEIEELEDDADNNRDEIEAKEAEIENLEKKLESLGTEFEKLKERRGVQIVHHDNLPDEIKQRYDRVKEITPLMASIHAEISEPKLSHMRRKKLVKDLIALDDERRAAWDAIDDWAEGKKISLPEEKRENRYSDDALIKGAQMARRVERLKDNIANSQKVADETDRDKIRENTLKRIAIYQTELDELTALLASDNQESGSDESKEDSKKDE